MGTAEVDYSMAQISFKTLKGGKYVYISVKGTPITYSLSIPVNAPNRKKAIELIQYLLHKIGNN